MAPDLLSGFLPERALGLPVCPVPKRGGCAGGVYPCGAQPQPGSGLCPGQGALAQRLCHRGLPGCGAAPAGTGPALSDRHPRCQQPPQRRGDGTLGHDLPLRLPGAMAAQKHPGHLPPLQNRSGGGPLGSARADSHTCCRPNTLPRRFQRPVPTSTAALPGLPVLAVRPRGRARFFLFAAARRCAGCLSWCAAPAFCSRRPCCRSAGQRALLRSGCRSGTACRAAPSCRQRTAG